MKKWLLRFYESLPVLRELSGLKRQLGWPASTRRIMVMTALIQALEVLKAGNERYRDPRRLIAHGAQYWSQNFEDGMIAEIFRRIGTTTKTFLEIGVGDGSENNSTALLSAGWKGTWIEGDPRCCASIRSQLSRMPKVSQRLVLHEAFVSRDNIQGLLAKLKVPEEVDLFSLDIDLNTYHIWAALPQFRPRAVVVEYNGAFPPEQSFIYSYRPDTSWDYTQDFGASLKAFELLGARLGYCLVGCDLTGINAFFVRNDLVGDHFVAPFTAENHHEPPRYQLWHRFAHPAKFFVEEQ
jgi:hypothetical protein